MKLKKLIKKIEKYYGMLYGHAQAHELEPYLEKFDTSWLSQLFDMTIRNFSITRGVLPDIAIFEQLRKDFQTRGDELNKGNALKIIKREEEIIPKGYEAKLYFDALWDIFPESVRSRRACRWEKKPFQDEIREKTL